MEDARALLDSLMGPSRDKKKSENQRADGWKDKNVCKLYLVGFCPNSAQDNWFHNTKRNATWICNKIHSDRLKDDFENHESYDKYVIEYEKEFLEILEGLVREADACIKREQTNCRGPQMVTKIPSEVKFKMDEMVAEADNVMAEAEEMADKGDLTKSKSSVEYSTQLREEVKELKEKHTYMSSGERVCEICGVRCKPDELDLSADFNAHLDGRLHQGYSKIRAKVKELRAKLRPRREPTDVDPDDPDAAKLAERRRERSRDRRRDEKPAAVPEEDGERRERRRDSEDDGRERRRRRRD